LFEITEQILIALNKNNVKRGNAISIKFDGFNEPCINSFFVDKTPNEIRDILITEIENLKVIDDYKIKRIINGIPGLEINIEERNTINGVPTRVSISIQPKERYE
jgi:hypothetical protein